MSLTKPIPKKMRDEMAEDPFMKYCCLKSGMCVGRIEWHHHLKFAGKRVNEKWCILPLCEWHHRQESRHKEQLDEIMVRRATHGQLLPYSKAIDYVGFKTQVEEND